MSCNEQGVSASDEELITAALQRILAAWPYKQQYIRKSGGFVRLSFSPGVGQINITWSDETVKPDKTK
jgi:hypothetical protein